MAYFVAKELGMRPTEILNDWNVEELMVSYGYYLNNHTAEYIESVPEKEWAKHKPKPIIWTDRWGVLFISPDQMDNMQEREQQEINEQDFLTAAQMLLG